ncbi:hypothetical protein HPP92_006643 [Vanilla planifolia]|uniref:Uncharacterized protein n=1 Tax=Vanilla planifolia TaxID=51239 RepID=A0A835RKA0_VANPL|nr:hypothetical protein HPP92_006643 [Vanilla planifolia]
MSSDNCTELRDAADFESILTPEGRLSVCGFGSLLSERSARSTFPDLKNFRVAVLRGFRRVFAHVAPIFFERGIAKEETKEVSSLSVEPCEGESLLITVFEITGSEVPSFIERENEFRFLAVVPEALDGARYNNSAVVCARYSDEEYFQIRCKGNVNIFFQNYGRYNINKIWRDDILPCRVYLRHWQGKASSDSSYLNGFKERDVEVFNLDVGLKKEKSVCARAGVVIKAIFNFMKDVVKEVQLKGPILDTVDFRCVLQDTILADNMDQAGKFYKNVFTLISEKLISAWVLQDGL